MLEARSQIRIKAPVQRLLGDAVGNAESRRASHGLLRGVKELRLGDPDPRQERRGSPAYGSGRETLHGADRFESAGAVATPSQQVGAGSGGRGHRPQATCARAGRSSVVLRGSGRTLGGSTQSALRRDEGTSQQRTSRVKPLGRASSDFKPDSPRVTKIAAQTTSNQTKKPVESSLSTGFLTLWRCPPT